MERSFVCLTAFVLLAFQSLAAQSTWLSDEQARDVASAAVHVLYPQPCYNTYRDEHLEGFLVELRKNPVIGNRLNDSVHFYRVASDSCEYVVEKDGKSVLMFEVMMDCCEYGIVAVDRGTATSYWFTGEKRADKFKEFVQDEQLRPDSSVPTLFTALYRDLVWGESTDNEIRSLGQLRDAAERSFKSAYSPYERDNAWERKFDRWWRKFQSRASQLKLDTTYEKTSEGTTVRGFGFSGFELTIPRSEPPPKGTLSLFQWALLVKSDGTVERLPSKVIYSAR